MRIPIFLLTLLLMTPLSADEDNVADNFIVFKTLPDKDANSDCSQRGGLRVFVVNTHPDKIIDLSVDRYFSGVRQAGRSMFALRQGHSQALGCNIVMDSHQEWRLVSSYFIEAEAAINRYGVIY
ncbi:hypothetical protein MDMS009_917 [Methylophaga thiooxydans DMS010]|uniref:Uncharacterized protein n=2 Tax=Methylophaga thiooxydans TaxID=392484 RepID=C0N458_9GAMM|nr:hypothetical protein MDMS009_917 [Methylophaga thiooxydans DMS010]